MSNPRRRLVQGLFLALTTVSVSIAAFPASAQAAPATLTVKTEGGSLNVRSGPNTSAGVMQRLANGSRVTANCAVPGENIRGAVRVSDSWLQLSTGGYVARAYLVGAEVAACTSGAASPPATPKATAAGAVTGTADTGGGALNIRTGPGLSFGVAGTYTHRAQFAITCQSTGDTVSGVVSRSNLWDRVGTNRYVAHAYVRSGTVARCSDPAPAPSATTKPPTPTPTAPASYTGTVQTGDGPVRIRSGASTGYSVLASAANGTKLTISCAATGQQIAGTVRNTNQWDRLVGAGYVSHAYVSSGTIPPCSGSGGGGGGAKEPSGSMTHAEFIAATAVGARQTFQQYRVPASVTIAQAIIESGWGTSKLTANDRNFFGIKCSNGYRGNIAVACHDYRTTECTPYCHETIASFRVYSTASNSIADHGVFLTVNSRYKPAFSYTGNADRFLYEIWKAGYATSPTYYDTVRNVMRTYNLYQYD